MLLSKNQLRKIICEAYELNKRAPDGYLAFNADEIDIVKNAMENYQNDKLYQIQQLLQNNNDEEFKFEWKEFEFAMKVVHTIIDKKAGTNKETCKRFEKLIRLVDPDLKFQNFWNLVGAKYYYDIENETALDIMYGYDMQSSYSFPNQDPDAIHEALGMNTIKSKSLRHIRESLSDMYKRVSDVETNGYFANFAREFLAKYDDMFNDYEQFTEEDKLQLRIYLSVFAQEIKDAESNWDRLEQINALIQIFIDANFKTPAAFAHMVMGVKRKDYTEFDDFVNLSDKVK